MRVWDSLLRRKERAGLKPGRYKGKTTAKGRYKGKTTARAWV
jgi:hypothetical protein